MFGVATALMRNPEIVAAMKEAGWDIASHSLKWIEHRHMPESQDQRAVTKSTFVPRRDADATMRLDRRALLSDLCSAAAPVSTQCRLLVLDVSRNQCSA